MCFSATVSYSAAVVLVTTGIYALHQARPLELPYTLLALIPVLFGIQQGFEGLVWQEIDAGQPGEAVPFALGFLFFSHFLWLWWFPLCSYLLEPKRIRRRLFLGLCMFGAVAGGVIYFTVLLNPDWLSVSVRQHSILYRVTSTLRGGIDIPVQASALYALIILVPLLASSDRYLRFFGILVVLSIALASLAYNYAFISVWCFFAAVISLYLVHMIHQARQAKAGKQTPYPSLSE